MKKKKSENVVGGKRQSTGGEPCCVEHLMCISKDLPTLHPVFYSCIYESRKNYF